MTLAHTRSHLIASLIRCDSYSHFHPGAGDGITPLKCEASEEEKRVAQIDHVWWKQTLGPFYSGFFDEMSNQPKPNFRKIMHIHVTDALIARYKEVKFVWAHMGLSMELTQVRLPPIATDCLPNYREQLGAQTGEIATERVTPPSPRVSPLLRPLFLLLSLLICKCSP